MKKFRIKTHTNGKGFWTVAKRAISITAMDIDYFSFSMGYKRGSTKTKMNVYGQLKVYFFNKKEWTNSKYGLIYTDPLWIKEFRQGLVKFGFSRSAANSVDYTEQGMQGSNYVSLSFSGLTFLKDFMTLTGYDITSNDSLIPFNI